MTAEDFYPVKIFYFRHPALTTKNDPFSVKLYQIDCRNDDEVMDVRQKLLEVVNEERQKNIEKNEILIQQGDEGDYFYIVKSGSFDIYVQRGTTPAVKVSEKGPGDFFGEIAMMYNSPRAATVKATSNSTVWALDRESFQMMLVTAENTKKKLYENLLDGIDLFDSLNKYEKGHSSV